MQAEHPALDGVDDPCLPELVTNGAHRAPEPAAGRGAGDSSREPGRTPGTAGPTVPGPTGTEERLNRIEAVLAATNDAVREGAERAAARERVIDRQHAEIERLKAVERVGAMRPVIVELCRLRNDLLRQALTLRPDTPVDRFAGLLKSFADSVAETLEECGVEPLPLEPGAPFVPQRHRVASVTPTSDPARDGTVAEVVADGYVETDGDRVVAPARVVLHRTPEPDSATPVPEPAGTTGIGDTVETLPNATDEETTDD